MKDGRTNALATTRALACALLICPAAPGAFAQSGRSRAAGQPQQQNQPQQTQGQSRQQGQPQPASDARSSSMRFELPTPVAETPVPLLDGPRGTFGPALSFTTPDAGFERKLVKGAPFSAEATTEHVQPLADGNRMTRRSSARLFRDAAGRTRREHLLTRGGAQANDDGEAPRLIVINDPVAGVNYIVETEAQTVRRREVPAALAEARARASGGEMSFGVLVPADVGRRRAAEGDSAPRPPAPKTERLEQRLIDGVLAEGTRTTLTVPAGEFHNEQPMEITHEQWYSPELQTVVLMRHSDPRFGETTYRLTNVVRGEPDRSLFEPPAGYRVVSETRPRDFPPRGAPVPPPRRP